jgi:hypothetical protein
MIVHCPVKQSSHKLRNYESTGSTYTSYIHACSLTRQINYDSEIEYNLYDISGSKKIFNHSIKINIKNPHKVSLQIFRKTKKYLFCTWLIGGQASTGNKGGLR